MTAPLGLVTIGQAPRVDVLPDLLPILNRRPYVEHGALDLLDAAGVAELAPTGDDLVLVSRLRDGSSVRLSHQRLRPLLLAAVERCIADGAGAVLVMCTGPIEPIRAAVEVHAAEPLAQAAIVARTRGFGVLSPDPAQLEEVRTRWAARAGQPVPAVAVDPYTAVPDELAEAGRQLAGLGVSSIVLDCFGYSVGMGETVAAATGLPVHVTRTVATEAALRLISNAGRPSA
ncbi:MAG: AroM family protein [Propionicimonas sp.]